MHKWSSWFYSTVEAHPIFCQELLWYSQNTQPTDCSMSFIALEDTWINSVSLQVLCKATTVLLSKSLAECFLLEIAALSPFPELKSKSKCNFQLKAC